MKQFASSFGKFWLSVALIASQAMAEDNALGLPPASSNQSDATVAGLAPQEPPEFLPVTQAYIPEVRLDGQTLQLHWDIEPGYYLYKSRFKVQARPALELDPRFPEGKRHFDEYFEKHMSVYYGSVTGSVRLPQDAPAFTLKVQSQGCADAGLCYPPHDDYWRVDPDAGTVERASAEAFDAAGKSAQATTRTPPLQRALWRVLLLAVIGGLILNLMPCVFPVLSIKVLSLASADRKRLPAHGWVYAVGVIASFIVFAGALLAARAGGEAIGWGFQLQSPALVATLVYLFLVMGLALSGVLNLGGGWMGAGQSLTQRSGLSGSFFTGILAAVVASPCTAPFMGVALGYAMTQPTGVALSVFAALGLGMALPLTLLCHFPRLVHHLPAPGPWMDRLKQLLAFPLYLSALWLLWVLGRQVSINAVALLLASVIAAAFALWLKTLKPAGGIGRAVRLISLIGAIVAALALAVGAARAPGQPDGRWQAYSAERLEALRAEGRPVLVNLTADWCLTCLANERITLDTEDAHALYDRYDIATLKGDWTNRDPRITRLLERYGRSGVPLYLWYAPGNSGQARILPQLLRPRHLEAVVSALEAK